MISRPRKACPATIGRLTLRTFAQSKFLPPLRTNARRFVAMTPIRLGATTWLPWKAPKSDTSYPRYPASSCGPRRPRVHRSRHQGRCPGAASSFPPDFQTCAHKDPTAARGRPPSATMSACNAVPEMRELSLHDGAESPPWVLSPRGMRRCGEGSDAPACRHAAADVGRAGSGL